MPSPFDQHRYQVRLEWGMAGLARLAPADVVVVVDVLGLSTRIVDACAAAAAPVGPAHETVSDGDALAVVRAAADTGALVLLGSLRNASATARAVLAEQTRRADRTSITVIAVGATDAAGTPRFAVEDLLGAGAVIDALTTLGIDHTAPEAAVAAEGFHGLRRATRHLLTASGSGQERLDGGARDDVLHAAEVDTVDVVPAFVDGTFIAR